MLSAGAAASVSGSDIGRAMLTAAMVSAFNAYGGGYRERGE